MKYPFTVLPSRLWEDLDGLTFADVKVLGCIASFADRDRQAWPKQQTIADRLGVTRQTVNGSIRTLVKRGYVQAISQFRKDGGQRENFYRVLFDEQVDPLDIVADFQGETPPAPPPVGSSRHPPVGSDPTPPVGSDPTPTKEEQDHKNNPPSPRKRGDENAKEIENAFDQIWAIWPEHGRKHSPGRKLCLRAFAKASTGIPLASMIAAVKAFVAQVDPRYAPSLSKWLREGKAEPWLPTATAITIPGGASALSTTTPPPTDADALKCLGELQARFGQTKVAAWFNDAVWDGKLVRLKSSYHAQRVTTDFGGVLREHGFTAVEGSAAA